jgi:integrase
MGTTQSTGRDTNSNIRWLKPGQVEAMRDAAYEGRHGPRDDAIVTVLYDTGLRRSELAAVDRAMLDLDAGDPRRDSEGLPQR